MTTAAACRAVNVDFPLPGRTLRVLAQLDLDIAAHEFVAVVGRSGCGKTTLLRVLAALQAPTSGQVEWRGSNGDGAGVAVVFQEGDLFPWRTALENVEFGRIARAEPSAERQKIARDHLERVGLAAAADLYPRQLSVGMQRRVSVARAFASGAALLLLDEPFASLDTQTRWELQAELNAVWSEEPRTVVFVTHDISEAIWLADRIVVLGSRPARVVDDLRVPFARPRRAELRWEAEFRSLEREVWERLGPAMPAYEEATP
jgi:NitT/TauT family transport system ATP-binding protein